MKMPIRSLLFSQADYLGHICVMGTPLQSKPDKPINGPLR